MATDINPPFLRVSNPPNLPAHQPTSTSAQTTKTQDHLQPWRHRPGRGGFRRGLASDIVLGDRHTFTGNDQYLSTMHADYDSGQLDAILNAEKAAKAAGRLGEGVYVPSGPAGKPLGINNTPGGRTEVHIAFGMDGIEPDAHRESLTKATYKAPPHSAFRHNLGPKATIDTSNLAVAQLHHQKPLTATSAAHLGLQTRQDLPIDDKHFRSFLTTNQEAYTAKVSVDGGRGGSSNLKRNRTSNIPEGDRDKQLSYETVAGTSFVNPGSASYRNRSRRVGRPSSHIVLSMGETGEGGRKEMYMSTSAAAYKGAPGFVPDRTFRVGASTVPISEAGHLRGKSSIAFGEGGEDRRETGLSVSQRDYLRDPVADAEARRAARSSVADRLLSKPGIATAICPYPNPRTDMETCSAMSYQPPDQRMKVYPSIQGRAAGIPSIDPSAHRPGSGRMGKSIMNRSSVPTGDTRAYNFKDFDTTTSHFFQPHPDAKMIPHPVLGANITRSNFTL
ncbi:hypothetical protein HK104_000171, partial [Borealophlyctis nickersoniae]